MKARTREKFLVTAALPYANGPLHFGHIAGAYLPADCFSRFQRLQKQDVAFICGSDEYGFAITMSAALAGRTPQEQVNFFHELNRSLFEKINISFDHYSRTTTPFHQEPVQRFFLDLLKNGYIEEKETEQLYSEQESRFLADRYVVGTCPKCSFDQARGDECTRCGASYEATDLLQPRSKMTGAPLVKKSTKHWFLRFDLFKEKLKSWIATKNWKPNVLQFAKNYIDDLRPRAITRDSTWGIPVPLPHAEGKVLYVWFDAPIGYISATQEWASQKGNPDLWKEFWFDDKTRLVQFIGKDNIPFHALFFPAMTMGQDLPYKLVDELPANEFLNLEGRQFSKSDNWTIDVESFFNKFTSDQLRYVLAANAPENHDSEFNWKDFQMRCNAELLGKFGNFINRTLVFAKQHCSSEVPAVPSELATEDRLFLEQIKRFAHEVSDAYSHFQVRKASQIIMELASTANTYFDARKPWLLAKEVATQPQMQAVIYCCLECIKALALLSFPIIPESSQKIWEMLGQTGRVAEQEWSSVIETPLKSKQPLPSPQLLFRRVEDEQIAEELAKLQKPVKEPVQMERAYLPLKAEVTFEQVQTLDLRVGCILSAERIPKSKKLLKLSVDLGFAQRTIVAGIGDKFEDLAVLIGKKIVVVANLKPAALMGVESQGMVLAASIDGGLELPSLQAALPGDPIY